jgi:general secretion pathway protein A
MYEKHFGLTELPFSVTPDPRFSYTNSFYREAFASLHFGIETRKGFIVITGEAGTGKTTLLRRFMRNVESTVHTAFIFNPHLDFTELLRLILNDLGIPNPTEDRLTMLAQLNEYLIEQLKRDHIVSLLVDEAQELSDEMLEELRLLSNLETDKEKLIQIVLIGQPELERKLDQPELRQLKQRVAIRCRLAPLGNREVAAYIDCRLKTVGYDGKQLFDAGSVRKVTQYSKGIPRLINVLCDNALLIAYTSSKSKVSAKIVEEAAHELQLIDPEESADTAESAQPNAEPPPTHVDQPPAQETVMATDSGVPEELRNFFRSRIEAQDRPTTSEQWRLDFEEVAAGAGDPYSRPRRRNLAGLGIGTFLTGLLLAGTGAVLYSQQSGSLAALGVNIEELIGIRREAPALSQVEPGTEVSQEQAPYAEPPVQAPAAQESESLARVPEQHADISKTKKATESSIPASDTRDQKTASAPPDQPRTVAKNRSLGQASEDGVVTAGKLRFEVHKAIYNRAIRGVEVSVQDGTVYLDGQVATEKQKLAAAQAARSVTGVRSVRDRIRVNFSVADQQGSEDGVVTAGKLEFEVHKAIYNRAIRGVEVSVQDGTVYLDGQVATEKQKLAATQAARSVTGVRIVRDRIRVNFSTADKRG